MFDLPPLPPLRDVIRTHNLRAQKALGQNFLLDPNLTDKIARAAGNLQGRTVFEIGPGPGGLTRSLLKQGAENLIAVEYDPRAVTALQDLKNAAQERLTVIQQDALKTDLLSLPNSEAPRIIAANLPYNIATKLLTNWLRQIRETPNAYETLILMFQKEVAQRLTARTNTKAYGRLSVLTQWLCDAEHLFDIPPSAFTPPPKVTSTVVRLTPKALPANAPPVEAVEAVTAAAFTQRRKMIRTSLKPYASFFESLNLSPELRAEDLPPATYLALAAKQLHKN